MLSYPDILTKYPWKYPHLQMFGWLKCPLHAPFFIRHCLVIASLWYWGLVVIFHLFSKTRLRSRIHINQSEENMMSSSPKQHNITETVVFAGLSVLAESRRRNKTICTVDHYILFETFDFHGDGNFKDFPFWGDLTSQRTFVATARNGR